MPSHAPYVVVSSAKLKQGMHLKSNFMVSVDDALDEHVVGRRWGRSALTTPNTLHWSHVLNGAIPTAMNRRPSPPNSSQIMRNKINGETDSSVKVSGGATRAGQQHNGQLGKC